MRELVGGLFIIAYVLCSGKCYKNERGALTTNLGGQRLWYHRCVSRLKRSLASCCLYSLVVVGATQQDFQHSKLTV